MRDYEELCACVNRHAVKTLVVGAHAVALHAKPRFTKDFDLFVEPSEESADGQTFEEAWAGKVSGFYGSQPVWYIGRAELIRNKAAAGRPQDLADLSWLRDHG